MVKNVWPPSPVAWDLCVSGPVSLPTNMPGIVMGLRRQILKGSVSCGGQPQQSVAKLPPSDLR